MAFRYMLRPKDYEVEDEIRRRNVNNMFYLSIYIMSFEIIMLISFMGIQDKLPTAYRLLYLSMYMFFLLFGLCTFVVMLRRRKQVKFEHRDRVFLDAYMIGFVQVVMLWGVIIALLDQPVYGQIIAFVTNYVFCACLLLVKPQVFIASELVSIAVLFLLLPIYQQNKSILLGHYINLTVLLTALTISSCRSYVTFYDNTKNALKIKNFSERDELTNLYNRRKMNEYIENEFINTTENVCSVGILMIDVDYFKTFNDAYGHVRGDYVLQSIGAVLEKISETHDVFASRYGGEEFIIIIKNKGAEQVSWIAREIKQGIAGLRIPHEASGVSDIITVSIGQHCGEGNQTQIYDIIKKADEALYEAKNRGRDQIVEL